MTTVGPRRDCRPLELCLKIRPMAALAASGLCVLRVETVGLAETSEHQGSSHGGWVGLDSVRAGRDSGSSKPWEKENC